MNKTSIALLLTTALIPFLTAAQDPVAFLPRQVVPSTEQLRYQQMEMVGFIHFGMNTFTGREWGYGDDDPALFNPVHCDPEQWVATAKAAGMKELILTAKHHDGFCLWPSRYTEHSIKNSPYKNGKGDLVKEFTDACRKYGLKAGLYLSPWDRNHKDYGKPEYMEYYRNQLRELLTQYGKINEIWFDGANGGDGYYGGARENRTIDKKTYYGWAETIALAKRLQPGIQIFSDAGPDLRWVGNEDGSAGETFWSTIADKGQVPGDCDMAYLNTGEPGGNRWMTGQCDVSVRPGWFYHAQEDSLVKTPRQLVDIYYRSVGRNAVLLLNLPPDRNGLLCDKDVAALKEFRRIIDETFRNNLTLHCHVTADNTRGNESRFAPGNITDGNPGTFWATGDVTNQAELILDLDSSAAFDRIMLSEPVAYGQQISGFEVSVLRDGTWQKLASGTTIGYKRLLRVPLSQGTKLKLRITGSEGPPALSEFGLFRSCREEI